MTQHAPNPTATVADRSHPWNRLAPSRLQDSFVRDRLPPPAQWPVFQCAGATLDYPEVLNVAEALLVGAVRRGHGARRAIVGPGVAGPVQWRYAELLDQAQRIARVLTEDLGLVSGNRLLLRGANTPMMAACLLGAWWAGLVVVPTMPLLRAAELSVILDKAQVHAALCDRRLAEELAHCRDPQHPHHAPVLRQVLHFHDAATDALEARIARATPLEAPCATSRDDAGLIAFTSGTTGKPKATVHFHRDVLAMCDLFPVHVLRMGPDDVVCGTPPIAFTFGLGGLLAFPLRHGACTVLQEKYTPESLLQTIRDHRCTQVYTAPTFYRQMAPLAGGFDLSSVCHSVSAGEALPDATRQAWKAATGLEMTDGIGGTELIHIYIAAAGAEVRRGSIGRVVPGYEACVVDPQMQPVPDGVPGRLAVRGPTGCRYLDDTRQSAYVQVGWNLPGDTFVRDADGYFYYQARNDDMIVSAGYNIAAPEVEDALLKHPAVAECGVIGAPDDERGQVVQAFVVLKSGETADTDMVDRLQAHVREAIAPFKYPRRITFVPALPRTETGKLQRFRLRQLAQENAP